MNVLTVTLIMTRMVTSVMTITVTVTSTTITVTAVATFLPTHSHSVHELSHHIIGQGRQVSSTLTVLGHHLDQEEHNTGEGWGRGHTYVGTVGKIL